MEILNKTSKEIAILEYIHGEEWIEKKLEKELKERRKKKWEKENKIYLKK